MNHTAVTFLSGDEALTKVSEDAAVLDASRRLPQGAYTTLRTHGGRGVVRNGSPPQGGEGDGGRFVFSCRHHRGHHRAVALSRAPGACRHRG